jgi:diadenosine tetraphosphate (Ap4A) HIT family hydrolase
MLVSTKPWTEVLVDTKDFTVYKDDFPVTEGHVLFVPKVEDWQHLVKCWEAAYKWGYDWTERGYCEAFNIGQNVGEAAGQTVEYAHVHLIPRRKGDMADPRGGVRHVIPSKGNYRKDLPNGNEAQLTKAARMHAEGELERAKTNILVYMNNSRYR